jgi:hypothetical protein
MKSILALLIGLVLAIVAGIWLRASRNEHAATLHPTEKPAAATEHPNDNRLAPAPRVPAYQSSAQSLATLAPTMRPEVFEGNVRRAYQVALEIPQTLAQLPCYCHCDRGQGHKSLHSCFIDEHGANCGICMNEAFMAYRLEKQQRLNIDQIREQIIKDFGRSSSH